MIIIKGKIEKTTKAQCKFRGEELLGPPKPVRKLFLVCQLQITLGEMLLGPQARFRITPIV